MRIYVQCVCVCVCVQVLVSLDFLCPLTDTGPQPYPQETTLTVCLAFSCVGCFFCEALYTQYLTLNWLIHVYIYSLSGLPPVIIVSRCSQHIQ